MTDEVEAPEIPVSVDVEATGRIPGPHSMISLGAVAYQPVDFKEISRFKVNLLELPDATREAATMAWWAQQPPAAWEAATLNAIDPRAAMTQFSRWLGGLPGRPKLMGWPLPVDFMFIYWYWVKFLGVDPPFGYDGIDIKSYAMRDLKRATLAGRSSGVSRQMLRKELGIPNTPFSHDALDDAVEQAALYIGMRKRLA
jgi:hypothetical protein